MQSKSKVEIINIKHRYNIFDDDCFEMTKLFQEYEEDDVIIHHKIKKIEKVVS